MGLPNLDWQDRASCRQPGMNPEAWFDINQYGVPKTIGWEAYGECLRCPVQGECFTFLSRAGVRATIGGGGWWNNQGRFVRDLDHDALAPQIAAKILGVSMVRFRELVREGAVPQLGRNGRFRLRDLRAAGDRLTALLEEVA